MAEAGLLTGFISSIFSAGAVCCQSNLPSRRRRQIVRSLSFSKLVRKIRSFQTHSDEKPGARSVFQRRLVPGPNSTGGLSIVETPEQFGPRNWGQATSAPPLLATGSVREIRKIINRGAADFVLMPKTNTTGVSDWPVERCRGENRSWPAVDLNRKHAVHWGAHTGLSRHYSVRAKSHSQSVRRAAEHGRPAARALHLTTSFRLKKPRPTFRNYRRGFETANEIVNNLWREGATDNLASHEQGVYPGFG